MWWAVSICSGWRDRVKLADFLRGSGADEWDAGGPNPDGAAIESRGHALDAQEQLGGEGRGGGQHLDVDEMAKATDVGITKAHVGRGQEVFAWLAQPNGAA